MAEGQYTIRCNGCGYSASASTEDAALAIAARHTAAVHSDAIAGHWLGTHMIITPPGGQPAARSEE